MHRKIESIIRDEMNHIGGQEVLLPVVMPATLLEESGRFSAVGLELIRFKERGSIDMGVPIRVIVSPKTLSRDVLEIVSRDKTYKNDLGIDVAIESIEAMVNEQLSKFDI